ncbi:hypothetical protein DL96DRAFT_389535 [Flagelloscypha sp. PMI_526]|nr:hypothetical protein DL96DRAFT_389535 [Flagelloscypha sp. PMI_526]
MTIGQAIQSHRILERIFQSDAWTNKIQHACVENLKIALDEIMNVGEIETPLDSPFMEKNPLAKCFVCVVNPDAATSCRLLRNYRSRTDQGPRCTIREVLHATLSNHAQLPAVCIQEEYFISALNRYTNPTHVLVKELGNAFPRNTLVACLANIGASDDRVQSMKIREHAEELASLLLSCQLVADDVAAHCHDLGAFFFRLAVHSGSEQESHIVGSDISRVKGQTIAYLSTNETSTIVDGLEEKLRERFGLVSIERLSKVSLSSVSISLIRITDSVAGKDGESRVAARLAKVEEHLDGTIFQDVKKWLTPIHQTSKLDANIRARSGTTCQWLLRNHTFMRWMEKKHGLFWFRGLMGTGKTVMSSFVIETLLARGDVYVAYYYFEFTNSTTLSEEAILRSLVCQLACASPSFMRTFHQKHSKGSLQPQLATLQDTLNELVSASAKPVFIIIDALDELPLAQRKYFLHSIVTFSRSNRASRTHVMVTSREEVDIYRAFNGEVDFELAVQGDLVRQDIVAFVDQELAAQKWTHWPRDAVEMARRLLNERADGQFRMVACQVDILQQVKTFEQLRRSLNYLPQTLGETYNYILGEIPEDLRDQAHLLFAILSFAPGPISVRELSALIAVEVGDEEDPSQLPVLQENNQMIDPLDVVDLGTSLVSRVDHYGTASLLLAHASVKEHLLLPSNTWFSLCEDIAHSMIARSCLALLVHFQILQQGNQNYPPFKSTDLNDVAALYSYSKNNWFKHVLPNGSRQLLRQQQQIYESFPWPCLDEINASPYKSTISPLASAASVSLFDLVEVLLNTRQWEKEDLTQALVAAACSRRVELISIHCCDILLTYGADVNGFARSFHSIFGHGVSSPLEGAASVGNMEIVRFLIEKGADVNACVGEHGSALQAGVCCRKLEIVRFLVEKGAEVNARGGTYGSALQAGASHGSLEIVRFLVEKGADVNASGGRHGSALQAGASYPSLEIVRFLVEKGADVNAGGGISGSALQAGAYWGSLEIVGFLVEQGADVNASGGEHSSALQAGAFNGSMEIVLLLVEKGADMNTSGGFYGSALQAGAYVGSLEIVRFLVEKGADVNASGGTYGSALQASAWSGNLEIVPFLVEKGADVNASGGIYGTSLQASASYGSLEIVRFLAERGADVNASGGTYGSALQAGARVGNLEIVVRFLVEKGADVNASGGEHGSALQAGAFHGSLDIVGFLVEKGADVNAIGGYHKTALNAAQDSYLLGLRQTDRDEFLQFLRSCGAKTWEEMSLCHK